MITITKEEIDQINIINSMSYLIESLYKRTIKVDLNDDINYTRKQNGNNKGQFGYYYSCAIGEISLILNKMKSESLLDLGSGVGLLLYILKTFNHELIVAGFEIEDTLITFLNYYQRSNLNMKNKDILTITKKDIESFDVIYFWEPLALEELCKIFVENLSKQMYKGQKIIYKPAGSIRTFLREDPTLIAYNPFENKLEEDKTEYNYGGYNIYQKI